MLKPHVSGAVNQIHSGEPIGTAQIFVPRLGKNVRVLWPPFRRGDFRSPCNCAEVYALADTNEARKAAGLPEVEEPRFICACDFVEVAE